MFVSVQEKLDKLVIKCYNKPSSNTAGWTKPWGRTIHINEGHWSWPNSIAETVLHETIHTLMRGEKVAYGCEEKCFPGSTANAVRRGNPCDCK